MPSIDNLEKIEKVVESKQLRLESVQFTELAMSSLQSIRVRVTLELAVGFAVTILVTALAASLGWNLAVIGIVLFLATLALAWFWIGRSVESSEAAVLVKERQAAQKTEEVLGKSPFEFFARETAEGLYNDDQTVIRTGEPVIDRERVNIDLKGGKSRWSLTAKMPRRDGTGKIIGVPGIARDITARKEAEQTLTRERTWYRALTDELPDALFVEDAEGHYISANLTFARNLGVKSTEEIIGKTAYDFFPEEQAARYRATEQAIMQSDKPMLNDTHMVVENGKRRWSQTSKWPLHDDQGKVVGLACVARNITAIREREQAEEKTKQKNKELATLNQIGQALSRLATPSEILELIKEMIGHVFNNRNLYIALYDEANQYVSFPVYQMDGEDKTSLPERPF
jgi:PAS domain S-box-containing protein